MLMELVGERERRAKDRGSSTKESLGMSTAVWYAWLLTDEGGWGGRRGR